MQLHSPHLDGACPLARNENSLGLFGYAGDSVIPPQAQQLHVQLLMDSTQPRGLLLKLHCVWGMAEFC